VKILFFVLAIFAILKVNAQNYLIAFTGSGASNTVSLVKVENLATGEMITLNGTDILNLKGDRSITSIDDKNIKSGLKIYPNPMIDNSIIEVYPPISGNATISIFNMSGKQITQIQSYLENSMQQFRLSGDGKGLYIVNIKGSNYQLSGKLICNGNTNGMLTIENISNNNQAIDKDVSMMRFKSTFSTINMQYTVGDRLKFTGISGKYSRVTTGIIEQDKIIAFNFMPCTDGDNNNYQVVKIGTQEWTAENLKTTKLNDSTLLIESIKGVEWREPNSWYSHRNDTTYAWIGPKDPYGALYNGVAVSTSKLCPTGWHVPTDAEWTTLTTYLGGESVAGGKLKETSLTHWDYINTGATNETGFTALPGGYCDGGLASGPGRDFGFEGYYWSTIENLAARSQFLGGQCQHLQGYFSYVEVYPLLLYNGASVRCLKGEVAQGLPVLSTTTANLITTTTATSGGNVINDGRTTVTVRGVCWSTTPNPTVALSTKTLNGPGTGTFTSSITGLTLNTTYYIRAYATNSLGTAYGNEISFTTITVPTLTTTAVSSITQTTATSGGNVTSDGRTTVTVRGVCWSTTPNPTIADSKTLNGAGVGTITSFTSSITGLTPNTTYYVRAYATNSVGTTYGNEISFTTYKTDAITDKDGNYYNIVTIGTQVWMAENLKTTRYRNGDLIGTTTPATLDISGESTPKYQWAYGGNASNVSTYGRLYTWYAVTDSRNVCPTSWHVPTNTEWTTLTNYLTNNGYGYQGSGNDIAKSMAATSGWIISSIAGNIGNDQASNNSSGFTALAGGIRNPTGPFALVGNMGLWWGSVPSNYWEFLSFEFSTVGNSYDSRPYGLSVRCVRD
jgi:uncharacterized protein (TIGR02145 family)